MPFLDGHAFKERVGGLIRGERYRVLAGKANDSLSQTERYILNYSVQVCSLWFVTRKCIPLVLRAGSLDGGGGGGGGAAAAAAAAATVAARRVPRCGASGGLRRAMN